MEARKVYQTMLSSSAATDAADITLLWWNYAEFEWLSSQGDRALEVIMRAAEQLGTAEGINILRAKRRLEEIARELPKARWKERQRWIKLRILLEILSGTVQGAVGVAEGFLEEELEKGIQHESLTVGFLLMLYHHSMTLHNPCPPALLRENVHKALETYPSNTIVLGLFLECERGEGVWGRVRGLLSEAGEGRAMEKTLSRRISDVWIAGWEKGRLEGEIERVRSGLGAAVVSDRYVGLLSGCWHALSCSAHPVEPGEALHFGGYTLSSR